MDTLAEKTENSVKPAKKFHYAWIIFASCLGIQFVGTGLCLTSFALMVMPVRTTLGVEMTQVTGLMFVQGYISAVILMFAGKLIEKIGLKKLLIPAGSLMVLAFFLMSRANSIEMLWVGAAILGCSSPFVSPLPGITLLNRWFANIAGRLTGIVMCMASFSALILTPTLVPFMGTDYHIGFTVFAILALVLMLIPAIFLVSDYPEKKGLKPFGFDKPAKEKKQTKQTTMYEGSDYYNWGLKLSQAVKSPLFWLVAIIVCILCMGGTFNNYWLSYMQEGGLDITAITIATSFRTFAIWATCMGNGWIGDRFGPMKAAIICLSACFIGFLTVLLFAGNFVPTVIGMTIYAFCMSTPTLILSMYARRFFGMKNYAAIASCLTLFFTLSGAFGHTLTGIIYDATGSYTSLFIIFMVLVVIALVAVFVAEMVQKKKVSQYREMTYDKQV